jgi:hypothetical protein
MHMHIDAPGKHITPSCIDDVLRTCASERARLRDNRDAMAHDANICCKRAFCRVQRATDDKRVECFVKS